jgi:hypothetical protein
MLGLVALALGGLVVGSALGLGEADQDHDDDVNTNLDDSELEPEDRSMDDLVEMVNVQPSIIDIGIPKNFETDNAVNEEPNRTNVETPPDIPAPQTIDTHDDFVDSSGSNDRIILDSSVSPTQISGDVTIHGNIAKFFSDDDELVQIDLGNGDDYLEVRDGAANIVTGDGADTVDASGLRAGEILANSGDVVYGSDIVADGSFPDGVAVTVDDAEFHGGDANELATAIGEGGILDGGGGNDVLAAFDGDVELRGGTGDDTILGNADSNSFYQDTRFTNISWVSNESMDTIDGGDGDDKISMSNGDIAIGGEGEDSFQIFHDFDSPSEAARILDFDPSEDALIVQVGGGYQGYDTEHESYDLSGRVSLVETDSGSELYVDGDVVAHIDGAHDLRIGIDDNKPENDYRSAEGKPYVDLNSGVGAEAKEFDVLVKVYWARF